MPTYSFVVNGAPVSVDTDGSVRLLWVLRDLLGITGPKHGCALSVCQACTSHINGEAFNPCGVPVSALRPDDHITTIEGLAATVGADLHPVQAAWLEHDVAQCGFCQPGQIMTAVAMLARARAEGRTVTDAELDDMHNVCRCGTYPRVRAAIRAAEAAIAAAATAAPTPGAAGSPAAAAGAAGAAPRSLPATGRDDAALLGAAAVAAGVAVAIRSATREADETR